MPRKRIETQNNAGIECASHESRICSEFCNRLLDEAKVVWIPGSAFGECGEGFARVAYTCSEEDLYEAIDRVRKFCKKLTG